MVRPAPVPALARRLDPGIAQITPSTYRNPGSLPTGGVLVVGASATGLQLADELRRAGRDVVLAAGRHSRLPRRYRGMDVFWWLDRLGIVRPHDRRGPDPVGARAEPSLGLVGRADHADLDLATLAAGGVEVAGRLAAVDGRRVGFATDLAASSSAAEARMARLLDAIDRHIDANRPCVGGPRAVAAGAGHRRSSAGIVRPARPPDRGRRLGHRVPAQLPVAAHPRPRPVGRDPPAARRHAGPRLYVLGQRFQHRRSSNLIDGVGLDAVGIASHVACRPSTRGGIRGAQLGRP